MRHAELVLLFLFSISICCGQSPKVYSVTSPEGSTAFELRIDEKGTLVGRLRFDKKYLTDWSQLGLTIDGFSLGQQTLVENNSRKTFNEKFAWPLGEDDTITNQCNELILSCRSQKVPFGIAVRVFDGSVAFRYEIPRITGMTNRILTKENTVFQFVDSFVLYQYNHESVFTPTAIDTFSRTSDLPTTLTSGRYYYSIGEAGNVNYTKAELVKGATANSLAIAFTKDSLVRLHGITNTPWRTISVSKTAVGLHKFSQLYLKLVQGSSVVPKWIKPGKLIRAQLTTQAGIECVDFAAAHNFQYIMYDAGWYGAEFRSSSDPTQTIPQIDLQRVIDYGKQKGIGVILYVNYVGLKAKLDTILPLYKKWGVAGLKFGFVDGYTQAGITWLIDAIKKVNAYGFVLNIHDNYKPTGLSKAFPALLTQEGIRGDENRPDAFHNTVLPFTRFLAGPADFTFCFPNPTNSFSNNVKVSKVQQLALTVIYFSPLQAIFWYGKPLDYTNEDEIEFFKHVPTVWNETHYLQGEIGKNISVARRHGETWFVGNAAGFEDWPGVLKFDFLSPGKKFTATIFEDTHEGRIAKKMITIKKGDNLPFDIKAKGGLAIIIVPSMP